MPILPPMAAAAPLPDPLRRRVVALVARRGEHPSRALLGGIARQTIARAMAGLPISAAMHALIDSRLAEAEADARAVHP